MTSLELRNISKGFKSGKVLEDISLSVKAGEIVVVFGPSGTVLPVCTTPTPAASPSTART